MAGRDSPNGTSGGPARLRTPAWCQRRSSPTPRRGGSAFAASIPSCAAFVDAEWPPALSDLRQRLEEFATAPARPERGARRGPFSLADEAPALVIPIPAPEAGEVRPGDREFAPPRTLGFTIVQLDRAYIQDEFLPALAGRYFASGGEFDYCVVITTRRDPRTVVYRSDPEDGAHLTPDATAGLFEVRFDEIENGLFGVVPSFMARRGAREPRRAFAGRGPRDSGVWEVGVTHRAGSLEALVARARLRNLAISFGSLLLLGASAVMIVLSSQRARRLAAQQVEFVAGVSHELRTPVAVVCAAGENLADGLVRDPEQVKVYGATVRDEGRRLADMIEQILEFAGIDARQRLRRRERIQVAGLVDEVLRADAATIAQRGVAVETDVPQGWAVTGDPAALRLALHNLVQNAAKYGGTPPWIGLHAERARAGRRDVVRLTVRDRGPGIAPGDERRIFEPFYRGRQALTAGVAGSGLGLSLVQRIAEAHGGTVEVVSTAGAGSAFTLVLPAATGPVSGRNEAEEARAQANPAR